MQKSATLNLRVDPEVKQSAESVLSQLGLPMSTAVDMFLRQVAMTGGIPFKVTLPEAPRSVDVGRMTDAELAMVLAESRRQIADGKGMSAGAALSSMREDLFGN